VGDEEYRLSIEYENKKTSSARIVGNEISLSVSESMDDAARREAISKLASRSLPPRGRGSPGMSGMRFVVLPWRGNGGHAACRP